MLWRGARPVRPAGRAAAAGQSSCRDRARQRRLRDVALTQFGVARMVPCGGREASATWGGVRGRVDRPSYLDGGAGLAVGSAAQGPRHGAGVKQSEEEEGSRRDGRRPRLGRPAVIAPALVTWRGDDWVRREFDGASRGLARARHATRSGRRDRTSGHARATRGVSMLPGVLAANPMRRSPGVRAAR